MSGGCGSSRAGAVYLAYVCSGLSMNTNSIQSASECRSQWLNDNEEQEDDTQNELRLNITIPLRMLSIFILFLSFLCLLAR